MCSLINTVIRRLATVSGYSTIGNIRGVTTWHRIEVVLNHPGIKRNWFCSYSMLPWYHYYYYWAHKRDTIIPLNGPCISKRFQYTPLYHFMLDTLNVNLYEIYTLFLIPNLDLSTCNSQIRFQLLVENACWCYNLNYKSKYSWIPNLMITKLFILSLNNTGNTMHFLYQILAWFCYSTTHATPSRKYSLWLIISLICIEGSCAILIYKIQ